MALATGHVLGCQTATIDSCTRGTSMFDSIAKARKSEVPVARSSCGGPISWQAPSPITKTLSESRIVRIRCAMQSTVDSLNVSRIVCWITASVSLSTEAVASSRSTILEFRSTARARHKSWRSPTLKEAPPSITTVSKPSGKDEIVLFDPKPLVPARFGRDGGSAIDEGLTLDGGSGEASSMQRIKASLITSSEYSLNGSRFRRKVMFPKNTGSCGIMDNDWRNVRRPNLPMSTPSISTCPSASSVRRNKLTMIELFPLPVRPTMPSFSPAFTENVRFVKAGSSSGR
mmetsp:Transcript_105954/g.297920  ORF Transcript_105954/g.297920 Transcript_105954/m.297920 type:complete len:287 (+) Transcript_105954:341-1201(+)